MAAFLTLLGGLDLSGIIDVLPPQVATGLATALPLLAGVVHLIRALGDFIDDGKINGSFRPLLLVLLLAALMLSPACTVGVDSSGGWSVRPDPKTIDAGLRYLIRHEEDPDGSKSGLTQWKYYDPATGEEIPEEDYAAWGIKP